MIPTLIPFLPSHEANLAKLGIPGRQSTTEQGLSSLRNNDPAFTPLGLSRTSCRTSFGVENEVEFDDALRSNSDIPYPLR